MQAYLRDIAGSVPGPRNKVSCNLFAGGRSCLQLIKNATPVKHNKMRCACNMIIREMQVVTVLSRGVTEHQLRAWPL